MRGLIDQAQSQDVFLTILSAMDLCVLGGPKQALTDEAPTRVWASLRPKGRQKLPGVIFEELEERGLLIRQPPAVPLAGGHLEPETQDYAYSPKLGAVMAARSRPAVAVTCELQELPTRHPRLFALGDEQDPVQALVREAPVAPPRGDYPHLGKAGPLAWFYQYDLVSKPSTATFLAGWALLRPEAKPKSVRLVTALLQRHRLRGTARTLALGRCDQCSDVPADEIAHLGLLDRSREVRPCELDVAARPGLRSSRELLGHRAPSAR